MKNKILYIVNIISLTCLILDSGGSLGLRSVSFLMIFLFALYGIIRYTTINKIFLVFYLLLLLSLILPIGISLSNSIPISEIIIWVIAFLAVPIFYFYVKGSGIGTGAFTVSGQIVAWVIIVLFCGRLFNIEFINTVNDYIKDNSEGFFGNKIFLSGDILPNVYFQGTLSLVICGVLCIHNKSYFTYLLILIALILAPSRTGFLLLTCWGLFIFLRRSALRIAILPFLIIFLYSVLSILPFGFELFSIFNGGGDGLEVRNGHIESLKAFYSNNPMSFFSGAGPGSLIYTKGTGDIQDNIEISQFEYVRKYGIFSFFFFNLFYFGPLLAKRRETYVTGALLVYYIVAFSNPVLYSLFAMLFLTYSYVKTYEISFNKI